MYRVISDSDVCWRRSEETFEKITDAAASLESKGGSLVVGKNIDHFAGPNADADRLLQGIFINLYSQEGKRLTPVDLRQLDALLRNDVVIITSLKVGTLRSVSPLPGTFSGLICDHRTPIPKNASAPYAG